MERPPDDTAGSPLVNIAGERVALGPLRRDLVPLYQRWHTDFTVQRTHGDLPAPLTAEQVAAWYDRVTADEREARFTIYERATQRPIGHAKLAGIDYRHRSGEFGILIGEAGCRGQGFGTETARLMLDYAFTALGLHSVWLMVFAFNLAGQRAYEKAGFRECGRRREAVLMGGHWWDIVYMDCLAREFTSPVLGKIFTPDQPRERASPAGAVAGSTQGQGAA